MKRDHEQKVEQRSSVAAFPNLQLRGREEPLTLNRITSGDELVRMMDGTYSHMNAAPDHLSSAQRELVGDFLQSAQDWGEILGEIGPKGYMDAGGDLQDQIDQLRENGLLVYGTVRTLKLFTSVGGEDAWPESVLKLVHEHEALEPTQD
jgi:hypothetical protein